MKYVRIFLMVVGLLALVGVAGWLFVGWNINRAFQPAVKAGGGFRQLADVLEASVGGTLARGNTRFQPVVSGKSATGEGALAFYQRNPRALKSDKKYFETWHSALAIADASRKSEHQSGEWKSSIAAAWVAPTQRTDAWGHAFCVESDQQQTIVVSPGPLAIGSLDCNTLKVPTEELNKMPQGRLNRLSSGDLVMVLRKQVR